MPALILLLLLSFVAHAFPITPREPETFPVDPVALIRGEETMGRDIFQVVRGNYRYLFVDAANRAEFEKHPEKYEIQMGGGCGRMGPLSGAGRVDLYAVHDGRIYIFASSACRTGFLKAPETMLERDDPVPAATPESAARGRELIDSAVKSIGGGERVDRLKSYRESRDRTQESSGRLYKVGTEINFASPCSYARRESWDGSWWSYVATADDSWTASGSDEVRTLDASQRKALLSEWNHHPLGILRARGRPDFVAVAIGSEQIGSERVELVVAHFDGAATTLGVDTTGRIVLTRNRGRGESLRIGVIERVYSEFREFGGLTLPTRALVGCDGTPWADASGTLTDVTINEPIPLQTFRRE